MMDAWIGHEMRFSRHGMSVLDWQKNTLNIFKNKKV